MTIDELKRSGRIIFECISGSRLYNLQLPDKSDFDIRGVYLNPSTEYLGLNEPEPQIQDEKHDVVYYSLKRFFELLQLANPNIIELAFVPKELSRIWTPIWQKLYDDRYIFVTKKAYYTHSAYAISQINKAKGCNKRVHNPQPEIMPSKEDFCFILPKDLGGFKVRVGRFFNYSGTNVTRSIFPARPVPLKKTDIDLSKCHVAALENTRDVYRLYYYGDKAKGIFRGNDMLVCESISIEEEFSNFIGLLIFNYDSFQKALKDWQQYWDWYSNRNESRWIDQEKGLLNYDQKNMCHCLRLILSCENILRNGFPIVRFEGADGEYLMKIRRGEFTYEEIMKVAENKKTLLNDLFNKSTLPESVDHKKVDELYRSISK